MIKSKVISGKTNIDHRASDENRIREINERGYHVSPQTLAERYFFRQNETNENSQLSYSYKLIASDSSLSVNSATELRELICFLQDCINVMEKNPPSDTNEKYHGILRK
jgi:hypothetical protein